MAYSCMRALIALATAAVLARATTAALIVDSPQAITKQVTVQLIQSAMNGGSPQATAFGNATQRAKIESGIDRIWAQAGIDIKVLPTVTPYNNTFAYQGNAGSSQRPSGDLNTIINNAASSGILSTDPLTLNLIFVNVVPFFDPDDLNDNNAAGYARIGANGITGYVGDTLLTFDNGLDVIASVFAHEIAHNLGLDHTSSGIANLMSPQGTSQQLSSTQIATARASNFARMYTPPTALPGDYNGNGKVDGADYVLWRNGGTGKTYAEWRSNFGQTAGSGNFTGSGDSISPAGISAVPEPNSILYLLAALPIAIASRRRALR